MARLNAILAKESRRVGSETITSALHQKRIEDQKRRLVGVVLCVVLCCCVVVWGYLIYANIELLN